MLMKRLGAFFLDIVQVFVFAIAIFLFVYLLILQPHKIKGASMTPNFPDGEYLLTDKVTYRFREPDRGDVIVFEAPTGTDGEEFIKRIIGLPGEEIQISQGSVFVNRNELKELYIPTSSYTASGEFLPEIRSITVPDNSYFVLGDNRDHSSDSRAWGYVKKEAITGRAWVVYWPVKSAGVIQKPDYSF